jgi:hypothetical protein
MTTYQFFTTAWTWNSIVFILSAVALIGYFLAFGQRGRPLYFAAAVVLGTSSAHTWFSTSYSC